jgi:hypothetical protein
LTEASQNKLTNERQSFWRDYELLVLLIDRHPFTYDTSDILHHTSSLILFATTWSGTSLKPPAVSENCVQVRLGINGRDGKQYNHAEGL